MATLAALYNDHLAERQKRTREVLEHNTLDASLIHSEELQKVFRDHLSYPFKVNVNFKAWVPITAVPLLLATG